MDLDAMRTAWRLKARYTVYRSEGHGTARGTSKTVLHTNLPWDQALLKAQIAEERLRSEAGYRAYVMCRPVVGVELERASP